MIGGETRIPLFHPTVLDSPTGIEFQRLGDTSSPCYALPLTLASRNRLHVESPVPEKTIMCINDDYNVLETATPTPLPSTQDAEEDKRIYTIQKTTR